MKSVHQATIEGFYAGGLLLKNTAQSPVVLQILKLESIYSLFYTPGSVAGVAQ